GECSRDARNSVELAEIVHCFGRRKSLRDRKLGHERPLRSAAHKELVAAKSERERVRGERLRPEMTRRESGRRVHVERRFEVERLQERESETPKRSMISESANRAQARPRQSPLWGREKAALRYNFPFPKECAAMEAEQINLIAAKLDDL